MVSGYHIGQCRLAPGCKIPFCTLALHYNGDHPAPVMVGPCGTVQSHVLKGLSREKLCIHPAWTCMWRSSPHTAPVNVRTLLRLCGNSHPLHPYDGPYFHGIFTKALSKTMKKICGDQAEVEPRC